MPGTPAVSIRGLTKTFGRLTAVSNLDLDVAPGEILGFLGLNGAGKTTTIRILLDLLRPTRGKAFVLGHDCQKDGLQARKEIGYLPGELGLYADLTGREVLDLLSGLSGRTADGLARHELQERLGLPDSDLRRKLREYSTGMKRKLGLIQALQSNARVLILDEPTEGLDPVMQQAFYELLKDVKQRGTTVFMSSHVLSEVDRVCDRIALLRRGELVLLGAVGEIRAMASRTVRVCFDDDVAPPQSSPPMLHFSEVAPREWTLTVDGYLQPLLSVLAGMPVRDLEIAEARLEDVVMKYYRES